MPAAARRPACLAPLLRLALLLCLVATAHAAAARRPKPRQKRKARNASLPKKTVQQRGLVREKTSARSILKQHALHCRNTTHKHFPAETLGYVTPWNGGGYDAAKTFAHKLTYVAPVWYQLRHQGEAGVELTGGHDADDGWLNDVRGCNADRSRCPAIVPRVMWELRSIPSAAEVGRVSQLLLSEAAAHSYDGFVLEVALVPQTLAVARAVAAALHKRDLLFMLVLPPGGNMSPELLNELATFVDRFSLMTYDFSRGRPGPNAPRHWMSSTVLKLAPDANGAVRSKILMGMPFYGYDNNEAVTGSAFLTRLQEHKPKLKWDGSSEEHFFVYSGDGGRRTVYYPSLHSIQRRLQLAEQLGVGISIWEIGQGLNYFFDLF